MLRVLRSLTPAQGAQLMAVYREGNEENIDYFHPGCTDRALALRQVEEGFLSFLEEFFSRPNNTYYVWEEDGAWRAALRLTDLEGFYYLEALETHPDFRRMGYGEALLRAVIDHLARSGPVCIRDCVAKHNAPSLAIHRKVGFTVERAIGMDYLNDTEDDGTYGMVYRQGG